MACAALEKERAAECWVGRSSGLLNCSMVLRHGDPGILSQGSAGYAGFPMLCRLKVLKAVKLVRKNLHMNRSFPNLYGQEGDWIDLKYNFGDSLALSFAGKLMGYSGLASPSEEVSACRGGTAQPGGN